MKPSQHRYSKALVTDAIIDFRLSLAPVVNLDRLAEIATLLTDTFPFKETMHLQTMAMQFDLLSGRSASEHTNSPNGYRLTSADRQFVVQIALDGFTFIHLKPYTDWSTFSYRAKQTWAVLKLKCPVSSIDRVALRYINRLDIGNAEALADYLVLRPGIPDGFPSTELKSFFVQLQMPQHDLESMLIINEARIADDSPDTLSYILDLDLFRITAWSGNQDDLAWEFLETLRDRKNLIFEKSITEKTREFMERNV